MKSPFPGMDPYMERHWGDVHQAVITYIRDWLQSRLPEDLRARMRERVYIEIPDVRRGEYYPDVRVIERPRPAPTAGSATAVADPASATGIDNGCAPAEPIFIHFDSEPITEGYIEIVDAKSGHRVVTAIEVLSPTNKQPGEGQRLYVKKRGERKLAGVNTVEIDLLRAGDRVLDGAATERASVTSHRISSVHLASGTTGHASPVYRVPLRERLPVISIPLRPADKEVVLDLQSILDQCYRNGGYDDIDYRAEPDPPLSADDSSWANALLREQGRR